MADGTIVETQKLGFWKKAKQILAGYGAKLLLDWGYDYLVYPILLWNFGTFWGGIYAATGAMVICFSLLMYYEKSKTDWLGSGTLAETKTFIQLWIGKNPTGFWRLVQLGLEKSDLFAFIFLTIFRDQFETTVFLRHGKFDGLKAKDYLIFFASGVLGNLYWIFRTEILIFALRVAFNHP